MKFGEAKNLIWKILDEYSSNGQVQVDDDYRLRMADVLNAQMKRLATVAKVTKAYTVPTVVSDRPQAYPMPDDFYQLNQLWADMKPIGRGQWLGEQLVLPGNEKREIIVDYYAFPADVTDDTPDETKLDLRDDACVCACYFAAAGLTLADLVVDSGKILAVANQMLETMRKDTERSMFIIRDDLV